MNAPVSSCPASGDSTTSYLSSPTQFSWSCFFLKKAYSPWSSLTGTFSVGRGVGDLGEAGDDLFRDFEGPAVEFGLVLALGGTTWANERIRGLDSSLEAFLETDNMGERPLEVKFPVA